MSLDMCELATEWMMEKQGGADYARDWLLALNLRQGVDATILPPAPQHANEMDAAKQKVMETSQLNGELAAVAIAAFADGNICAADASNIVVECRKIIEKA